MAKLSDELLNAQLDYIEECFGWQQCDYCRHFHHDGTCDAFPKGIPSEILGGQHNHRQPFTGDNGIRFEEADELPEYMRRSGEHGSDDDKASSG